MVVGKGACLPPRPAENAERAAMEFEAFEGVLPTFESSQPLCVPRIRVVFACPGPCSEPPRRPCGYSGKDPLQPSRRPASTGPFPSWPRLSPRAGCKRGAVWLLRFTERNSLRSGRRRSFSGDAGSPTAAEALLQGCERRLVSALGVGVREGTGKIHPRLTSRDRIPEV